MAFLFNPQPTIVDDYKALVCLYFFGANDAHNTVIPRRGDNRATYDKYRADQVNVGVPANRAPINALTDDWRLHPKLTAFKDAWDTGNLGVVLNVGMLQEPTTRAQYLARSVHLPDQLFSHNSQTEQWQSLPAYHQLGVDGWMGRAADLMNAKYNSESFRGLPSTYSVYGSRTQMMGKDSAGNDLQASGVMVATPGMAHGSKLVTDEHFTKARSRSEYGNLLQDLFATRMTSAITAQQALSEKLQELSVPAVFKYILWKRMTNLSQQLRMVLRVITSRRQLGQKRQMFFVGLGGFDNHANLRAGHDAQMGVVDDAVKTFWSALGDSGLRNNVTLFTQSEFGRALLQNGSKGVDHGWGSHHFVLGGAVKGGVYGGLDMTLGGPEDTSQGRYIPSTSVDQYVATLLRWWGVEEEHLPLIVPNFGKFSPGILPGMF